MNGGWGIKSHDGDLDRETEVRETSLGLGVGAILVTNRHWLPQRLFPPPPLEPPGVISHPSLQPSLTIAHTFSVCPSGWNYSPLIELKTRGD